MECRNTILDDLAAEIGFTATNVLSAMYGGKPLYIPLEADPNHPLYKLIGGPAFRALVKSPFGGTNIRFMPRNVMYLRYSRWREVKDMLLEGKSTNDVAEKVGISASHVNNIRHVLEDAGILPMVFKGKDVDRS